MTIFLILLVATSTAFLMPFFLLPVLLFFGTILQALFGTEAEPEHIRQRRIYEANKNPQGHNGRFKPKKKR